MQNMSTKERMNIVIVGHVDHGKSTIIGRLMADTDSLPKGKIDAVREKCRKNSKPFEYAFLLDALKDEQDQGITIDSARCFFTTEKRDYIIIDAPGHIEFLKNMVTGAARAETALLVIDAHEGIKENSKRHGYMLSMLGVKTVAVLVNKMDLVEYDENIFNSITREYKAFLRNIDIEVETFIPVSGFYGDNIAARSSKTDWYTGRNLLEYLDSLELKSKDSGLDFRMPVQGVYKFTKDGDNRRIVAGTVASGTLKNGDEVIFHPSGKKSKVNKIEGFNTELNSTAYEGQATGFTLQEQIYIKRGQLVSKVGEKYPESSNMLQANIFWLGSKPLKEGNIYTIKAGSERVEGEIEKIIKVIDASELNLTSQSEIKRHEVGEVIIKLTEEIAFDLCSCLLDTSRFVVVDEYEIVGGGIITNDASIESEINKTENSYENNNLNVARGVNRSQRALRLSQSPTLILLVRNEFEEADEIGSAIEEYLFEVGRQAYYVNGSLQMKFRELIKLSGHLLNTGSMVIADSNKLEVLDLKQLGIPQDDIITIGISDQDDYVYDLKYSNKTRDINQIIHDLIELLSQKRRMFHVRQVG